MDTAKMNLEQKLVELRKLLPYIKKEKQSTGVKYPSFKLDDIWERIQAKMNELGINTRIIDEKNGCFETYERATQYNTTLMFLYQSDVTVEWVNVDDTKDRFQKTLHVIGSNDDPAKAKGAAYTYAFKYDLAYQFSIPMGKVDPDSVNTEPDDNAEPDNGNYQNNDYAPPPQQYNQQQYSPQEAYSPPNQSNYSSGTNSGTASEKQRKMIYAITRALDMSKDKAKELIYEQTGKSSSTELSKTEASKVITELKRLQNGN